MQTTARTIAKAVEMNIHLGHLGWATLDKTRIEVVVTLRGGWLCRDAAV